MARHNPYPMYMKEFIPVCDLKNRNYKKDKFEKKSSYSVSQSEFKKTVIPSSCLRLRRISMVGINANASA